MLYLDPPFHLVEGVSVFRDHADPLQWYYLPLGPRLSTRFDPATGTAVPQIQVIKFRAAAGSGGFLNFDVDLGIDAETLDTVASEIRRIGRLDGEPRLAPVPLVDGSVRLLLFDAETPAEPPPGNGGGTGGGTTPPPGGGDGEATGPRFVLKLSHNAKPALYGENRAAFSVRLSPEGVTVLDKALRGEMSPIGIVYRLDFLGLRPAYHVRIEADWDRVQEHLEEHTRVSVPLFYQSQIDEIVDELIEQQVIRIVVDTFVVEGDESAGGVLARRDQAVADLQDMITETFFEPSLEPMPREDGSEQDLATAQRIGRMIASGGILGEPVYAYSKVDIRRVDRKRLDVDMRERTAVRRSIYPQGHLAGLFRVLREPGMDPERFVLSVDADDPWFQRRKVRVISRADFADDSIASLDVRLDYGGEPGSVLLDPQHPEAEVDWASHVDGGTLQREVTARYTVRFRDVDGTERPIALSSGERTLTTDNLEIDPRELYGLVPVPIVALNFPWQRYSHIEVHARYRDDDHGIRQVDDFLLDEKTPEATWKMFVRDPAKTGFEIKRIYRSVDHRDVEMPWTPWPDVRVVLRDPFPRKHEVMVVPVLDWQLVDRAFVDVAYHDAANGVHEEASFEFTEQDKTSKPFRVSLVDPQQRRVSFRVTVIGKDGSLVETPESHTLERRIMVRGDTRGHRIVLIRSGEGDFATLRVRDLTVEARYRDDGNGLSFADQFVLRSAADRVHFEYDFVDGTAPFEYRVARRFSNGLSRQTEWLRTGESELVVPVAVA